MIGHRNGTCTIKSAYIKSQRSFLDIVYLRDPDGEAAVVGVAVAVADGR